jgi:DNA mismatch endonuclease (patch repair protein)
MERALRDKLVGGTFGNVARGDMRRMKAVRGKNNRTTERRFRALLVGAGMRGWKVRPKGIPGSPDVYFPEARLAVFLDGCYWHACPRCGHVPRINRTFWSAKLQRNQERDREKERRLAEDGIRVVRFWEHELAEEGTACLRRLREAIQRRAE